MKKNCKSMFLFFYFDFDLRKDELVINDNSTTILRDHLGMQTSWDIHELFEIDLQKAHLNLISNELSLNKTSLINRTAWAWAL